MKKEYIMPTMLVTDFEVELPLASSPDVTPMNYNRMGNGVQLGNERGDWDDDEDDELF